VMAARELAAAGWPVDEAAVERGLMRASLPARIEVIAKRPLVVVDAAHNVASMESLLETVGPALTGRRPRVLLFAASRDKQIEEMLALARGGFEQVVVTRYLTNPRAAPLDRLVAACRTARLPAPHVSPSPPEALRLARRLAGPGGSVVVAGSFFLAGELGR
jgi:dihydrofolate synthase / folylpolyglutamate synthase